MIRKPPACLGCPLAEKGTGFAPPEGPVGAAILLLGEALGQQEAAVGRPFVGDAGGMLQRLLTLRGWDRQDLRIANVVSCQPPNNWLEGAPWQREAIQHCRTHRDPVLDAGPTVVVPLGSVALKTVLGLEGRKKIRVNDFHGTITRDPLNRFWVVPTFHPSFLQRGAHNLLGTVLWDLGQAEKAASGSPLRAPYSLVQDPPLLWVAAWVDRVLAANRDEPGAYPVSVDVETPDKAHGRDEGEITTADRSYTILRVNLACDPDEGITVPFQGPYIDLLKRLLWDRTVLWLWNKEYDIPRLIQAGVVPADVHHRAHDLMWAWHLLQSDLPRGLGFVAPFYSDFGPWKHEADAEAVWYAAVDALQTHRVGFGLLTDLQAQGQWDVYLRHVHQLHAAVLQPAQTVGVGVDRAALLAFKADLSEKATRLLGELQAAVPVAVLPLTPKQGLTAPPIGCHPKASALTKQGTPRKGKPSTPEKYDLYKRAVVVEQLILKEVWICRTCGQVEVPKRHRCKQGEASLSLEIASVSRWFWREPFNPDSPPQVLAAIKAKGHAPGKARKTHKDTTDRQTLEKLEHTGDPFYRGLLDYRAVIKIKGTYVEGTESRLDAADRIHPVPMFTPSTMRLSYTDPNITNVVGDKDGPTLASGFRACIRAEAGARLLEVDFSGIEAVEVGWYSRDPAYIRLAKLGVHAGLASHFLGRPYDPRWADAEIGAYFKSLKKQHPSIYNQAKRCVHGDNYGLTEFGMVQQFPDAFPTLAVARKFKGVYRKMAPAVPAWQKQVRERAFRQHYLGGPGDHPFGYKHWFWSVFTYKRITEQQRRTLVRRYPDDPPVAVINGTPFKVALGEDGKRCVAFYPQSTAAGVLKEAMLRLFGDPDSPDYLGDAYFGRTPLRAPIHDSLLLEVPQRAWDRVYETVCRVMLAPILAQPCPEEWGLGSHLTIGIEAKASALGGTWGAMETVDIPVGVAGDVIRTAEADETEEAADLQRSA